MSALSRWPALVLTAGLATRLRPLSTVRAKAALPVAGEALVCRILRGLRAAGVTRVVLNLHHRAETITRVVGDGSALGLDVRYSWEPVVLGSAGGPARALPLLEADRFLIVNGDTLADVNLADLARQHLDTGALVTMAVISGDPRYNSVLADVDGRVHGFGQRAAPGTPAPGTVAPTPAPRHPGTLAPWHFIGLQAVNAAAFAGVDPDVASETVRGLYPRLIAAAPGSVRVFARDAEFFDIGTPRDYLDTAIRIAEREGAPARRRPPCRDRPRRAPRPHRRVGRRHDRPGRGAHRVRRHRRGPRARGGAPRTMLARRVGPWHDRRTVLMDPRLLAIPHRTTSGRPCREGRAPHRRRVRSPLLPRAAARRAPHRARPAPGSHRVRHDALRRRRAPHVAGAAAGARAAPPFRFARHPRAGGPRRRHAAGAPRRGHAGRARGAVPAGGDVHRAPAAAGRGRCARTPTRRTASPSTSRSSRGSSSSSSSTTSSPIAARSRRTRSARRSARSGPRSSRSWRRSRGCSAIATITAAT